MSEQPKEDALVRALEQLRRARPPAGWEQAVLRTIDAREREARFTPRRWKRQLFRLVAPALAVAAATAIALVVIDPGDESQVATIAVAMKSEPGPTARRSSSAAVGDSLRVDVTLVDPGEPWDLRLYRDDELVACCRCRARDVEPSTCVVEDGRIEQRWEIEQHGSYRAVVFAGDRLSPDGAGLVEDIAAAEQADVAVERTAPIEAF